MVIFLQIYLISFFFKCWWYGRDKTCFTNFSAFGKSPFLNPKYLVLDDYFHGDHHQDMYKLISQFDLEIMKEYKTHQGQVLIKNKLRKERNAI